MRALGTGLCDLCVSRMRVGSGDKGMVPGKGYGFHWIEVVVW